MFTLWRQSPGVPPQYCIQRSPCLFLPRARKGHSKSAMDVHSNVRMTDEWQCTTVVQSLQWDSRRTKEIGEYRGASTGNDESMMTIYLIIGKWINSQILSESILNRTDADKFFNKIWQNIKDGDYIGKYVKEKFYFMKLIYIIQQNWENKKVRRWININE